MLDRITCLLIALLLLLIPKVGYDGNYTSINADNGCIKEAVLTLKPDLDDKEAAAISTAILKYSRERDLDPALVVAIMYQESHFKLNIVSRTHDYCLMQINISNIKSYKLSAKKLLSNHDYCVDWGTRILVLFKNLYAGKESLWWSRYNSPIPANRREYEMLVMGYYNTIKPRASEKLSMFNYLLASIQAL